MPLVQLTVPDEYSSDKTVGNWSISSNSGSGSSAGSALQHLQWASTKRSVIGPQSRSKSLS
jgi:hypothetical protein